MNREQRRLLLRGGAILAVLLLLWAGWVWVIPRTAVDVETVYHHSYSGNFIQCRITNEGTTSFSGLELELSVWNDTLLVEQETWRPGTLAPHTSIKLPPLIYHEPAAYDYQLLLTLRFSDERGSYELHWSHTIAEYANLEWLDSYRDT